MRPGGSFQGLGSVQGHLEERDVFPPREREASLVMCPEAYMGFQGLGSLIWGDLERRVGWGS